MDNKKDNIEFPNQIIQDVEMSGRVKQAFIEYAMSVIVARALPDVRDGMKPGQRRIMYAMYEDHLTSDKPFYKSATTVVTCWVAIILTEMLPFTAPWCVWHRIFLSVIPSLRVRVTSAPWTETAQPLTVPQRQDLPRSPTS